MIALVSVFMVLTIGAMMALSMNVLTFYTARSEAQLAADAAALAAARVIANSGATSDTSGTTLATVETANTGLATTVAQQVAEQNQVAGAFLAKTNVTSVTFGGNPANLPANPTVTVTIQVTKVPAYFARILGTPFVTVTASATAEAYNPSASSTAITNTAPPVAPICVKPWLLPNIDPTQTTATLPIFNRTTGAIMNSALLGQSWPNTSVNNPNPDGLYALCGDCSGGVTPPSSGGFYPVAVDPTGTTTVGDFPVPTQALPACSSAMTTNYQLAVAGCVPLPVSCGSTATTTPTVNVDIGVYAAGTRDRDTVTAAECLIHQTTATPGESDSIDPTYAAPPFQFIAGSQNPVAGAIGKDVMVSDSLVTIPVFDYYPGMANPPSLTNPGATVIGFLQVFLNSSATATLPSTGPTQLHDQQWEIPATIINMVGCGTSSNGQPILGNGGSPVAVRLISPTS